jgi:hypothetical protein
VLEVTGADGKSTRGAIHQTASPAARLKNLRLCSGFLGLTMPAVVDDEKNTANQAYAAWPVRLIAVDTGGRIALKGNRTWAGFSVDPLETWLRETAG